MGFFNRLFASGDSTDRPEAILSKHLDADFKAFPMAESRQSPDRVHAIAARYGVQYPSEYIAHVCGRFPGIYVEVIESVWPRNKEFDIGPFWSFLYALHTFTPDPQSEPWMRLEDAAEDMNRDVQLQIAPVLRIVGDADLYCVDAAGKLVKFNHETSEPEPVDLSFWELLDREVAALRKRKDKKKPGVYLGVR